MQSGVRGDCLQISPSPNVDGERIGNSTEHIGDHTEVMQFGTSFLSVGQQSIFEVQDELNMFSVRRCM